MWVRPQNIVWYGLKLIVPGAWDVRGRLHHPQSGEGVSSGLPRAGRLPLPEESPLQCVEVQGNLQNQWKRGQIKQGGLYQNEDQGCRLGTVSNSPQDQKVNCVKLK